MMGTRDVAATMKRDAPDRMGNAPFAQWQQQHRQVRLGTFAQAASHGEMLINATAGEASLEVLKHAGDANLAGKVLLDIANPLDFSRGMPPTLTVSNTDSLGEQLQRAFPRAKVVKSLNTISRHPSGRRVRSSSSQRLLSMPGRQDGSTTAAGRSSPRPTPVIRRPSNGSGRRAPGWPGWGGSLVVFRSHSQVRFPHLRRFETVEPVFLAFQRRGESPLQ